ncbi:MULTISPECIES: hypothetical protein [Streptomyces]|uniref:hypothetical protein n=1 Tax=Streptomyces TaxID=1883 RepID=UPI001E54D25E|nr:MULTISPECIES: hypothetical protein [Streptomyces]UFQ18231.1 hypothetical protein J2N69_26320 [Streptomyces huasconensis]WCL87844.1 hypothetical protein PPN52_26315 [Streptomyces sp. JCM 35825]
MKAVEAVVLAVLLLGIVLGLLQAVVRAHRDTQILRMLRGALADCSPDERTRLCLELVQVLRSTAVLPLGGPQPPEGQG